MEVKQREAAKKFVKDWTGKGYEKGESQKFWLQLLREVLGVENPEQFISFEDKVHLDHTSFIDGYIDKTHVLIEQKSADKDLDKAIKQSDGSWLKPFQQAKRYSAELPYSKRPRWVVTCNFQKFCIYDMEQPNGEPQEILLRNLEKEYYRLSFLVNTGSESLKKEMEVSIKAGEIVGVIYDALLKQYLDKDNEDTLKSLNKLCVRLVFCLYAEDAGIFGKHNMFHDYMKQFDTKFFRNALIDLFKILDTPFDKRDPYLEPDLAAFPYVNGGLFADEHIEIPQFTDEIRDLILEKASADFDWSEISPTIFGAVFESTLNPETRRKGGMHYTSIENIHKVIDPLFMDELNQEFEEIKNSPINKQRNNKLEEFQNKIANLTFLDPACGSGNFLTETYISLRKLENEVLKELYSKNGILQGKLGYGGDFNPIKVSIQQFYGIEINDFAVTVAKTALWIAESQMMKETEDIIHMDLDFLPLKTYTNIIEGNALRINWEDVVPKEKLNYIMGNPPFVGASMMTSSQKQDTINILGKIKLANSIDYVAGWYFKAAELISSSLSEGGIKGGCQSKTQSAPISTSSLKREENTYIHCAFVSTNSITQGEQVAALFKPLYDRFNFHIDFAYRTFRWDSESNSKAHVHCVIIGFSCGNNENKKKKLYTNGQVKLVDNINAYLIDAPNIFIASRGKPICNVPILTMGNKPTDNGNFILSEQERNDLLQKYPELNICIKRYIGARDFLNNNEIRYCLWLKGIAPNLYHSNKEVMKRLKAIQDFRASSSALPTRKFAEKPYLFFSSPQTNKPYLIIPRVSSEKRKYIPIGFMSPDVIAADSCSIICGANKFHFGVLTSNVHMAWTKTVCGRLEMRYRYSGGIVYNNFPWCNPTPEQKAKIEQTAQGILDARALYPDSSLADLYDDLTMPVELRKAHQLNDAAVMSAYGFTIKNEQTGKPRWLSESETVARLMQMYQELTKNK